MRHFAQMLLGCVVPFMFVFLLPLFGAGEGVTMLVFVILMFSCHLFMMRRHLDRSHEHGDLDVKGEYHAHP